KGDLFSRIYNDSDWHAYPAQAKREEALLYWQAKDYWKRAQQEAIFREQVEARLPSPGLVESLRCLLCERLVHAQTKKVHSMAKEFIEAVALTPRKARKSASLSTVEELDPDHHWHCYEQEAKWLNDYTAQLD